MTAYSQQLAWSALGKAGASGVINDYSYAHPMSRNLSGVIIEQTAIPTAADQSGGWVYQELYLPTNYPRGVDNRVPALTGFSMLVTATTPATAAYSLDVYLDDYGWLNLAQGSAQTQKNSATSAYTDAVWFDIYFESVDVSQIWQKKFRIGLDPTGGITNIFYTAPNPLSLVNRGIASDGVTSVAGGGNTASVCFKLFGATADSGTDFLGNQYRSLVVRNEAVNIDTTDSAIRDKFWLSKPNPSKFAIENLYFDLRNGIDPVVVDRLYLDPITPGVWFNVYYSNDDTPGYDEDSWNDLLWTRIPRKFVAQRAEEFAFPEPIRAKYIKVEFTHLQARYYQPGNFQTPIQYKKHPRWVLDYFLTLYEKDIRLDKYSDNSVTLRYDTLDLAYNYYADDIRQFVNAPLTVQSSADANALIEFYKTQVPDTANVGDLDTLVQIRQTMQPFLNSPILGTRAKYLLADYVPQGTPDSYSTELMTYATASAARRTTNDQAQLVLEKGYPVTFFYLTCRHRYRKSQGLFENDRGYFAGIREIAFTRERYATRSDTSIYIESVGDNINVETNDFEWQDGAWVVNTSDKDLAARIDTGTDPSV